MWWVERKILIGLQADTVVVQKCGVEPVVMMQTKLSSALWRIARTVWRVFGSFDCQQKKGGGVRGRRAVILVTRDEVRKVCGLRSGSAVDATASRRRWGASFQSEDAAQSRDLARSVSDSFRALEVGGQRCGLRAAAEAGRLRVKCWTRSEVKAGRVKGFVGKDARQRRRAKRWLTMKEGIVRGGADGGRRRGCKRERMSVQVGARRRHGRGRRARAKG